MVPSDGRLASPAAVAGSAGSLTRMVELMINPAQAVVRELGSVGGSLNALSRAGQINNTRNSAGAWTIIAIDQEIRNSAAEALDFEATGRAAQIFLDVRDVRRAEVFDYLRAYSYMASRKLSAGNAVLMNRLATDLNLDPRQAREGVEQALGARLICPVGGKFVLKQDAGGES